MRLLIIGYGNPAAAMTVWGWRSSTGCASAWAVRPGRGGRWVRRAPRERRRHPLPATAHARAGGDAGGVRSRLVCGRAPGGLPELVRHTPLAPSFEPALVSHHMKPEALLALAVQLYGGAPEAALISIRGFDFDFGEELSERRLRARSRWLGSFGQQSRCIAWRRTWPNSSRPS